MNDRQKRAMIEFHKKAEKAYRSVGKVKDAEAAKKLRQRLEAAL